VLLVWSGFLLQARRINEIYNPRTSTAARDFIVPPSATISIKEV
jgi:hypothetical protein